MGKRKNRKYGNKQSDVKKDREKDIELYAEALYLALKNMMKKVKQIHIISLKIQTKKKSLDK